LIICVAGGMMGGWGVGGSPNSDEGHTLWYSLWYRLFIFLGDTLTLREMILSIPQHLQNIHHFPDNVNYKASNQCSGSHDHLVWIQIRGSKPLVSFCFHLWPSALIVTYYVIRVNFSKWIRNCNLFSGVSTWTCLRREEASSGSSLAVW
jgi:hypothetical protein